MIEELFKLRDLSNFTSQRCKRWGVRINNFSNVLGVILIEGVMHYDSDKNTRSNSELKEYRDKNKINKKVLIYIIQHDDPRVIYNNFGATNDERELNMRRLMAVYEKFGPYDAVIYGKGAPNFKFARSKTFFIKLKNATFGDIGENRNVFVQNVTLECDSSL